MAPYPSNGSLTTNKLTIDDTGGFSSQSEWEAYQSAQNVEMVDGAVQLAETTIDSGNLQAHYATRLLDGYSDGDVVDSFTDAATNNDAVAIGDPIYRTDRVNGEPATAYDGTDDAHDTGIVVDTDQPRSIYAVIRFSGTGQFALGSFDSAGDGVRLYVGVGAEGNYDLGYGDTFAAGSAATTGNYLIVSCVYGSGSGEVWENQTSKGTLTYSGAGSGSYSYYLGARNNDGTADLHHGDDLVEVLDYQAEHDDSTRQSVESYLNDIYNIL